MTSKEIRKKYLEFFKSKGHAIIPSASLIPENDPTVLFTTAGMHPLVPFLMGESHPDGKRLTSCQKCIRTGDIDDVGDRWHLTFFEMLGNWSLGDYFKKESITWSWEFLTDSKWLALEKDKISVTVFVGDETVLKDEETYHIWRDIMGIPEERIYYFGKKENWWGPAGKTGPCGPDTEIFYDTGLLACGPECNPSCGCGKYVEIWNNVFMEFNKQVDGAFTKLDQKNVDTGMGLERITAVMNGKQEAYETDLFLPIMNKIKELAQAQNDTSMEIIADHLRAATFIMMDGISPSNMDQGYILRRLIRRAIREGKKLGIENDFCGDVAKVIIDEYKDVYEELDLKRSEIVMELTQEEEKFRKTLNNGLRKFNEYLQTEVRNGIFSCKAAFDLYQSYGFPIEMTKEEALKQDLKVDESGFCERLNDHQKKSQEASKGKFAGGLADASEMSKKYHTTTHILHSSLRRILGDHVQQKGSNINDQRLRFDFTHPSKLTPEQIKQVEDLVNETINRNLSINCKEMSVDNAKSHGAIGLFTSKYGNRVKVYEVGNFSKEICGGPHVLNTSELGHFVIKKEESSSSGVRRIKAVLE
ncbi:MAG: alanine--tRNA ligase [Patescibacteria group bacterium]